VRPNALPDIANKRQKTQRNRESQSDKLSASAEITVVADSREQRPWTFASPTIIRGLPVGDYSIAGLETAIAIERKSLTDFVGSITFGRARFWRELEKLAAYTHRAVIVEASTADVLAGAYRSKAAPWAVLTSGLAITADFGIPVFFCGDRATAARCAEWLLRRWASKVGADSKRIPGEALPTTAAKFPSDQRAA
jgi:ERCC4-type nuclease